VGANPSLSVFLKIKVFLPLCANNAAMMLLPPAANFLGNFETKQKEQRGA